MMFEYDEKKTMELISRILSKQAFSQSMAITRLMKLLYIFDRESMEECGRPITGETYLCIDGYVITGTNIIEAFPDYRGSNKDLSGYTQPVWETLSLSRHHDVGQVKHYSRFFHCYDYRIFLKKVIPPARTSPNEINAADKICKRFARHSDSDLVKFITSFKEIKEKKGLSGKIEHADILAALEHSGENILKRED